jgi:divalent metal cation (Fe/Co/Zn/Cd) transporter
MLFSAGGLFALYEGIEKIRHPHHLDDPIVAIIVLLIAIGLESFSLRTAVGESRHLKGNDSWFGFIRHAKNPELPVVLLEDVAALVGLLFALLGVGLTMATDQPVWDGIGTCLIGVLLLCVAVILIVETKSLLVGEAAAPAQVRRIEAGQAGDGSRGLAARRRRRDRRRRAASPRRRAVGAGDLPRAGSGPRRQVMPVAPLRQAPAGATA